MLTRDAVSGILYCRLPTISLNTPYWNMTQLGADDFTHDENSFAIFSSKENDNYISYTISSLNKPI